jgi:SAM-dependent methyltransferase
MNITRKWRNPLDATSAGLPQDFTGPTALPSDPRQAEAWQDRNRTWWESHPMRYDLERGLNAQQEGTLEFYREIDERLFRSARTAFPWRNIPFDNFIDYGGIAAQRVLEIGVGTGIHAALLAKHAGEYVGVDLTKYATATTLRRLDILKLPATILQMDAEKLQFDDASFDFVWSWGVIHHSSNTRRIVEEVHRVLRPGGKFVAMVYHRSLWNQYVRGGLYYGILRGGFLRGRTIHDLIQETTDGALARYYTVPEWNTLVRDLFRVQRTTIIGHKTQLIPLPYGPIKELAARLVPDSLGRVLTNRALMGYMLVAEMQRKS